MYAEMDIIHNFTKFYILLSEENSFKWLHNKKKKKITSSTSVASKHTKKNSKSKNLSQNNNGSSNCLLLIPPNNTVTPNTTPALNQPFYLIANSPTNKNIKPPNIDLGNYIFLLD